MSKTTLKIMSKMSEISPLQKLFLVEYLKTFDIKHSAMKAGYKGNAAKVNACVFLNNPKIKDYIEEVLKDKIKHLEVPKGYFVHRLLKVIEYGLSETENPKDLSVGLKALDMLIKLLNIGDLEVCEDSVNKIKIEGLNTDKI